MGSSSYSVTDEWRHRRVWKQTGQDPNIGYWEPCWEPIRTIEPPPPLPWSVRHPHLATALIGVALFLCLSLGLWCWAV